MIVSNIVSTKIEKKMTSKEQRKKAIKIYHRFVEMTKNGMGKMEAYKLLAVRYKKSLSGIRYIVLIGKDYERPAAPPTPKPVEDDLPW